MSTVLRLFVSLLFFFILILPSDAQIGFSDQSGGFGPFIGLVQSNLLQPARVGDKVGVLDMYHGWEAGIKSELYRTKWMRGNLMASYLQQGATEYFEVENSTRSVDIGLQQIKLALNPLIFKVGDDFFHGYAGGGIYGSYIIKQELSDPSIADQYWTNGDELTGRDVGLDFIAGIHIWKFDIEAHAQYGLLELGKRWDGSTVKHQFFGLHIAYLWVNNHLTVKSCRDSRKSNPKNRM
ncbi:MAG: hypothetical protein KDC80_23925 [Saprospiraceae bacterium]|nr:hypothetical protein [Saprospiraceae bacterium]